MRAFVCPAAFRYTPFKGLNSESKCREACRARSWCKAYEFYPGHLAELPSGRACELHKTLPTATAAEFPDEQDPLARRHICCVKIDAAV